MPNLSDNLCRVSTSTYCWLVRRHCLSRTVGNRQEQTRFVWIVRAFSAVRRKAWCWCSWLQAAEGRPSSCRQLFTVGLSDDALSKVIATALQRSMPASKMSRNSNRSSEQRLLRPTLWAPSWARGPTLGYWVCSEIRTNPVCLVLVLKPMNSMYIWQATFAVIGRKQFLYCSRLDVSTRFLAGVPRSMDVLPEVLQVSSDRIILKICSKEFEFDDALRLTTVVRCQNSIWWSIGLCLSDILLNMVVNTAHVSFWEALFEAEKPNCNLHRNRFDLSWENNWPFANVNLISAALHRLRWCWTKRLVWHPLVWQLCWWILATFMIFPIRCPYLFADHYPENRIQVCIATRDRLTTKSHRSSVCMSTSDFVCENLKHVLPDQSRP